MRKTGEIRYIRRLAGSIGSLLLPPVGTMLTNGNRVIRSPA